MIELPAQPPRILVVDDTPDIRDLLSFYLMQEGYVVQAASGGKHALELLDEFSPDVMCIDFLMPGMDGQELARQIRARRDMLYVPIVMITAVSGVESVKLESLSSGVDAFLTKPVRREELKVTVRTMLRVKAAQDKMLTALERVAEVQDELLQYERQQGQYEAIQTILSTLTYELTAPFNAAEKATNKLEELFNKVETRQVHFTQISVDTQTSLKELRNALGQAKASLKQLIDVSRKN